MEIESIVAQNFESVIQILAAAFVDDPVCRCLYPDLRQYSVSFPDKQIRLTQPLDWRGLAGCSHFEVAIKGLSLSRGTIKHSLDHAWRHGMDTLDREWETCSGPDRPDFCAVAHRKHGRAHHGRQEDAMKSVGNHKGCRSQLSDQFLPGAGRGIGNVHCPTI